MASGLLLGVGMASSPLLQLAQIEITIRKFALLRWLIRALLLVLMLSAFVYNQTIAPFIWGLFFLVLPFGIMLDLLRLFIHQEVKRYESDYRAHGIGITYDLAYILARSKSNTAAIRHYVLHASSTLFVLTRLGVLVGDIQAPLAQGTPDFHEWMHEAAILAKSQHQPLAMKHVFETLQKSPALDAFWRERGITDKERDDVWEWYDRLMQGTRSVERGFIHQLRFSGGIGRDWSSGYTHTLEVFASDVTAQLQRLGRAITLVGHTEEKRTIVEYLNRGHAHNIILIGEEGIGKERLIYALASDFVASNVPLNLKYRHLYMLDVGRVVSGASEAEQEAQLRAVLDEASSVGNIILVIPDFHFLVGGTAAKAAGMMNASAVLAPYLESSDIHIIALTSPDAYYRYVKPNHSLDTYLLPVEVKEIGSLEALHIIQDEVFRYEGQSIFTYQALAKIITICEQHVHDKPYPEKALELLDEVSGKLAERAHSLITSQDVEQVLSQKLKVPLGTASANERDVLNNLEELIRGRIIGQTEAVKAVANALRRVRAGLHSGKRPIGSFLFLGPTGVGKTEMAKTIAALYYKNDKAFIRLDMSEYQTAESIEKLIGTETTPGLLTTAITDQPFSVVLLDEIEKAAPSIRNLFLQILDDGHITDGYGKRVDFTNAMVIATSNAGAEYIREAVAQNNVNDQLRPHLLELLQTQGTFSPEWLNRFDSVVVFLPLTKDEIRQVAKLQVQDLVQRVKGHNINLTVADDVYDFLVEKGYDPQFGARPMRRAVQDTIETVLAKSLLNDSSAGTKDITLTKDMLS